MSWFVSASGTQGASVGVEQTLQTDTTNGTFVLSVDTTNMVSGDTVELRLYTKVLSTGALDLVWKGTYSNAQAAIVKQSPFVANNQSLKATLKQTAGVARNFDWKLLYQ